MTVQSPAAIRSMNQQQWQTEVARWHSDIGSWHQECRMALRDLRRLEAALQEQEGALQAYEQILSSYEEYLANHQSAQTESLPEVGEGVVLLPSVSSEQAAKHCRQQDAHERCKRRHYTLMAHWSLLCQTLTGEQP